MKKPVLIIAYSGRSGIGDYSHSLCGALARAGQPTMLITNQAFPYETSVSEYRIFRLFRRLRWYPLDYIRLLAKLLRTGKGVVHFQSYLYSPCAECLLLTCLRLAGTRMLITVHDLLPHSSRFYHRAVFHVYYRLFHRLIVHSSATKRNLLTEFRMAIDTIRVIPHGVYEHFLPSIPISKEHARSEIGANADDFVILFFGHITERKGIEDLAEAFALIRDRYPKAKLAVVGKPGTRLDTPLEEIIQAFIRDNRVIADLSFLPPGKVTLFFTAADVIVLPYREMTTSGVLKIAMAFHLPVIATALGEIPEFITDGVNGFLCPPRNPSAIAACLETLMNNKEVLREMRAKAAERQRDELSWDRIAERTKEVYEELS